MDVESLAAAVHQAYLDTCERLGWPVKPENQVPYNELSEDSKELDRASVRAVLDAVFPQGVRYRVLQDDLDGPVRIIKEARLQSVSFDLDGPGTILSVD